MILDTLNMFLGFVGIMLILSLMVTALVQFIQSALMIRARNLRVGLESLIEKLQAENVARSSRRLSGYAIATVGSPDAGEAEEKVPEAPDAKKDAKALADHLVRDCRFVPKSKDPHSMTAKVGSNLKGPTCSWITEEELIERLRQENVIASQEEIDLHLAGLPKNRGSIAESDRERISALFQRMEAYLNKRFQMYIRIITIICAVAVAVFFQVSTPELLNRLHSDAAYRERSARLSEDFSGEAEALIQENAKYENISDAALERLAAKHPELGSLLLRASGIGENRADIIEELQLVLEPLPASKRSAVIKDYEKLLDDLRKEAMESSAKQVGYLTDKLSAYDITPWAQGPEYFAKWTNIVGVLITAIFLTFGAPFWYERLRELIQLRDALKPKPETDSEKK